jgi:hypothetical protein
MNTHGINEAQFNEDPPSPVQYVLASIAAIAAMAVQGRVIASGAASVACSAVLSVGNLLTQYGQAAITAFAAITAIGSRTLQGRRGDGDGHCRNDGHDFRAFRERAGCQSDAPVR